MKKITSEEIKIKEVSRIYNLSLGEYSIQVTKIEDGLTITTSDNHDKFKFDNSDPEAVEAIGKLLIEASRQ